MNTDLGTELPRIDMTTKLGIRLRGYPTKRELAKMAVTDKLTGLLNREGLKIAAPSAIGRNEFAIVMIDIDFFKEYNDTMGHEAGDKVLVGTSDFLRNNIRQGDVLARIGGEEFVIIMPNITDKKGLAEHVDGLRSRLHDDKLEIEKGIVTRTASFGIAFGLSDVPVNDVIKLADKALYQAKQKGRNRIVVYSETKE